MELEKGELMIKERKSVMQLFMVYVGGSNEGANIELHDIRFVIGKTIEGCYPELINQWWGDQKTLHLDAWGAVKSADGYEVFVKNTPANQHEKLYFVNLGGYDLKQFTELHENILIVAKDNAEAKVKAKSQIKDWTKPHRDNLFDVEKILELTNIGDHYIHLKKTANHKPFEFTCAYKKIT